MTRAERLRACAAAMRLGQSMENILADHPGSVLAGGALRDTIIGKPVKDYDIFIPCWDGVLPNGDALIGASGDYGTFEVFKVKHVNYADQHFDLIYVLPGETAGENFAQWVIDQFDFNISKVAYDPSTGLCFGDGFWTDVVEKCLTLARRRAGWERYYERLLEKFPDYLFCDTEFDFVDAVQTTNGVGITQ